jgi:hypothetical protein
VLSRVYRERFGVRNAWTLHEAADVLRFRPLPVPKTEDVVWIGNWGDEERTQELRDFWLGPASRHRDLRWTAHGVRYPDYALAELRDAGVEFRGWAPSLRVAELFSAARATLHVPRRAYVDALAGIPTIRVFEALACGIPLGLRAVERRRGVFRPGDYAVAETPRRDGGHPPAPGARRGRGAPPGGARAGDDPRPPHLRPPRDELLPIRGTLGAAGSAGTRPNRRARMHLTFFGSSLVSSYWNGAATYYRGLLRAPPRARHASPSASRTRTAPAEARPG